jgi:hypothetical protein
LLLLLLLLVLVLVLVLLLLIAVTAHVMLAQQGGVQQAAQFVKQEHTAAAILRQPAGAATVGPPVSPALTTGSLTGNLKSVKPTTVLQSDPIWFPSAVLSKHIFFVQWMSTNNIAS